MQWPGSETEQYALWSKSSELQRRWPHGPPLFHEPCCSLHTRSGACDCKASDASDSDWGLS